MKKILIYLIINLIIFNGCDIEHSKENKKPTIPVLTSPSNNATNIKLEATVNWTASTDEDGDALKYSVYFGTENPPTTIVSTSQSEISYSPTLKENTTYYWKVSVSDGKGGVSESEVWSFKTIVPPPSVPTLTAPANAAVNVSLTPNLTWNASTSIGGYPIKYNVFLDTSSTALTSSTLTKKVSNLQTSTSYTPTGLLSNTTYYWKIEANDGNGGVNVSEIRSFKTLLALPTLPRLTAPDNNATNISLTPNLTWSASTTIGGYPIKYNVFLDTSSTSLTSLTKKVSSMQDATSYTPTSLLSNSTYYWKIEANDGNGGVAVSEISNFKTIVPPSVPVLTSPANLATDISINTNLTWTASTTPSSNDIKYKVFLDTSSTFTSTVKVESNLLINTSYTLTNLLSNKNYYWKVIAVDGNGLMTESEVRIFKSLIVPPSVPTLSTPVNGAIEVTLTPTLTWSASTSSSGIAAKYNVYIGTEKTSITKVSNLQPETSYTANSLLKNTKYYLKIEADDGNGGITSSVIDSFTVIIFDLVNVESGTFTMGCTTEQGSDCDPDESPAHSVTLSNFSIGKYEVTQAQWLSVMGSNPSNFNTCSDCPLEQVSWDDIQTFLTTLNKKTGKSYRLPTEAEWEYAARGGKKSNGYKYSGSNDIDSVAWYNGNSGSKTHVVGTTKKANELGIYDMSGNIYEWCSDWYDSYTSSIQTNPIGQNTGSLRVLRGGSWISNAVSTRVSNRNSNTPSNRGSNYGFRLVLP